VTPGRTGQRWSGCAAALLIVATAPGATTSQEPAPAPVQTLCVLDFQRLGDDPRSDWLQRGLADLMIANLSSLSPYLVIERRHLRDILREHGLAASGLVDVGTAVQRARLAKAQVLLLGSFARQGDLLAIQARLIRVGEIAGKKALQQAAEVLGDRVIQALVSGR
jgi:TolB-like protein